MSEINRELEQLIVNYSKSVDLGWHLITPDIEDAMFTAHERDTIHQMIKQSKDEDTIAKIKQIDSRWQKQLLGYIADGEVEVPYYPNDDEPSCKWWFHIEELDKLSEEDRATL